MRRNIQVSLVAFSKASGSDRDSGLLGWVVVEVEGWLILDGLTLRRTRNGRLSISLPARMDKTGKRRPYIGMVGAAHRLEFESLVLQALQASGGSQ